MSPDPVAVPPAAAAWARPVPDRLPAAAVALAGSCLVGQLVQLGAAGARPPDEGWLPSMALGALLVGWVAAGVLKARTGRLVVVWVLFAQAATSLAALVSLAWFRTTRYYAWQRTRPRVPGPSVAPLVAVAVAVGVLGGVIDLEERQAPVHIEFGDL